MPNSRKKHNTIAASAKSSREASKVVVQVASGGEKSITQLSGVANICDTNDGRTTFSGVNKYAAVASLDWQNHHLKSYVWFNTR